jgi:hypothetical protein
VEKDSQDISIDIDKRIDELINLDLEFIEQVRELKFLNNNIIKVDDIEKIYNAYYKKRETMLKTACDFYRKKSIHFK